MTQLTVRNLDEETVAALKERAAQNGRSAEAEHRQILRQALRGGTPFSDGERDAFFAATERLRQRLRTSGPSTDVLREMRDTRRTE